jgi:ParB family transcriptional regulator, chromosome partitioning protein
MQIDSIPLDRLSVSKTNMRQGKKPPDVTDILPSIIKRGVLSPLFVRPNCNAGHYEIVAGKRRFFASEIAAKECEARAILPCIVLGEGDDAEALEVSMIENLLRQNPDQVTQWESYTRLVKEGRSVEDIAATFALTEVQVKRILALGNLLPRIREAFRAEEIDAATVKHLTLASKAQQKAWLALYDDEEAYTPHGQQLKAWLFGGASVSVKTALFDVAAYDGQIVTNLFEEDGYFADADAFWTAQMAEVEARKAALIEEGWSDVIVIPPHQHFSQWEHEKTPKRKGGRVYIQCRDNGEVVFHEGYITTKEAQRIRKVEATGSSETAKPTRPELTSTLASYVDLHRHAAVRHQLAIQSSVALRVMVAHAICGSPLWSVKVQEQKTRNDAVNESIENCVAEARFDEQRRAVLAVLGFDAERATLTCHRYSGGAIGPLVTRLLDLPDAVVMEVLGIVMAETLASGSDLIETLGPVLKVDMAEYWTADAAFHETLRDREVGLAILAEVGGSAVATANAAEKGKTIKGLIADFLTGENGRPKTDRWVPRWMAFPPSAYTGRGGVPTVANANRARWIAEQERPDEPDPDAPASAAALPADADVAETVAAQVPEGADERLAA